LRLKLFEKNFWVIDKNLEKDVENLKFKKIAKILSPFVLQNCP